MPTLVTYRMLVEEAATNGLPPDMLAKVGSLFEDGLDALALAHSRGTLRSDMLCCAALHV